MASTATTAACALVSSALVEGRAAASPHCIGLQSLPPPSSSTIALASINRPRGSWKSTAYCRKIARNVVAMAVGDAPAEVSTVAVEDAPAEVADMAVGDAPAEASTEMPEIVKNILDAWDKVEDKYAVTSLGAAGLIALWGSTGMISAIDKLPLVPGALELVGIGYTGGYIWDARCVTHNHPVLYYSWSLRNFNGRRKQRAEQKKAE